MFKDAIVTRVPRRRQLLPGIDSRCFWVKRCKEILTAHVTDLGGEDALSEAERSIVRRAAVLVVECERLERRFALVPMHETVSLGELHTYSMLANTLRRLLDMAGLEKRTHDITPTIDAYIVAHQDDPDGTDEGEAIIDVLPDTTPPPEAYPGPAADARREFKPRFTHVGKPKPKAKPEAATQPAEAAQ